MDSVGEKCGVFGVYGEGLAASRLTFFGLYAPQHRGQESSGIAATNGQGLLCHKDMGLVAHVFNEEIIKTLSGHGAIGHNRYSTAGASKLVHAQPIMVNGNSIALVHNGNLSNTKFLVDFLASRGIDLSEASDSRMVAEAIGVLVREGRDLEKAVEEVFLLLIGAFSILVMDTDRLIAFRDGYGIRPLALGRLAGGYIFSSETCAFHPIGATFLRDVRPGEMVVVDREGIREIRLSEGRQKLDVFEFVYFSRPDSELLGRSVYEVRKNFGIELAKEYPLHADVVIPVPETAIPVAIGYSSASRIPLEMGLVKNRYIHRTFIEPEQHVREQGIKVKLTPLPHVIHGRSVVVVDDSIVRGTTSKQIVRVLFEAGAKEVHFLVSSPPVKYPDFYGIDTPRQGDLLAANQSLPEMRAYLGATSLHFLSYAGMIRAVGLPEASLCTSCFTGEYPIDIGEQSQAIQFG